MAEMFEVVTTAIVAKDNKYLIFLGIADEFGEKYSDELIIDLAN